MIYPLEIVYLILHEIFVVDERLQDEILRRAKEQNPAMQTG